MMTKSFETKVALAQALKKLASKKPLNKISIQNIVDDCNVNRQTFYYHFGDIYDLLGFIFRYEGIDRFKNDLTLTRLEDELLDVFKYIEENYSFCMNIYQSLDFKKLNSFIEDSVKELILYSIDKLEVPVTVSTEDKEFFARFYSPAFISLIGRWALDGMSETPEEIIRKTKSIIGNDLLLALENLSKGGNG